MVVRHFAFADGVRKRGGFLDAGKAIRHESAEKVSLFRQSAKYDLQYCSCRIC
jgi:hypothetical protein